MTFLIRPFSFLLIMFFAYALKQAGLFQKELALIILRIIMNCTLPALIISSFGKNEPDLRLCLLTLLGLLASLIPYLLMLLLTHGRDKGVRVYRMISVSGFNIGCYGMPVLDAFFGGTAGMAAAMFDLGNSLMMTSGNYALTSIFLQTDGTETKISLPALGRRFFSSVPVCCYLVMFVFMLCGIRLPETFLELISPAAGANAFLSMFMLGLLFTLPRSVSDWKETLHVLVFRFAILSVTAFAMYRILPFSLEIRQITVLLLMCPIGAMAPAFIERCHGDGELAAFTNSISTILSLVIMTILAGYFTY